MVEIFGVSFSITTLTGWGAFSALCWIIIKGYKEGKTYPLVFVEQIRADRDARLAEVGAWRTAYQEEHKINVELIAQNSKLMELAETSAHVLKSLPPTSGADRKGINDG